MKKATTILALLLVVCLLFVGCQPADDTSATTTTADGTVTTTTTDGSGENTDATTTTVEGGENTDTTTTTDGQSGQQVTTTTTKKKTTGTTGSIASGKVDDKVVGLGTERYAKREGVTGDIKVFIPWDVSDEYTQLKADFEKQYPGTKIEYVSSPWNTRNSKLANQVKANKTPDAVSAYYVDFPSRAIKNLVQPLDDYLVEKDILNTTVMENITSYNGKSYALMRKQYPYVIYYNVDMFDEYGEKTPLEYYNEGTWTWENFRKTALAMTDVKNGKVNTFGFGIDDEGIFMLAAQTDAVKIENGTVKLNVSDPKFTSSLDFFYKMVNTDKSVLTERWLNFNFFLEEQTAMAYWRGDQDSIDRLKEAKIEWDIVPFPKADGVKDYYGIAGGDGWSLGYNCKNPLGGIAFAEFQLNHGADKNDKIGYSTDQKERMASIVSTYSLVGCYGMDVSFNNGFCNAMRNNASMSAKLEEYIPEWNILIDDVINGK